jgi:hypothetical protein
MAAIPSAVQRQRRRLRLRHLHEAPPRSCSRGRAPTSKRLALPTAPAQRRGTARLTGCGRDDDEDAATDSLFSRAEKRRRVCRPTNMYYNARCTRTPPLCGGQLRPTAALLHGPSRSNTRDVYRPSSVCLSLCRSLVSRAAPRLQLQWRPTRQPTFDRTTASAQDRDGHLPAEAKDRGSRSGPRASCGEAAARPAPLGSSGPLSPFEHRRYLSRHRSLYSPRLP